MISNCVACEHVLFVRSYVLQVLRRLSMLLQTSQKLSVITRDKYHDEFGRNRRDHSSVLKCQLCCFELKSFVD